MVKKVYLGGLVEAHDSGREVTTHKLKQMGLEPVNPRRGEELVTEKGAIVSTTGGYPVTDKLMVARDLNDLRQIKLSGGFTIFNLTPSEGRHPIGSLFEMQWCYDNTVPIITIMGHQAPPYLKHHPWITNHSTHILSNLPHTLNLIEKYFAV